MNKYIDKLLEKREEELKKREKEKWELRQIRKLAKKGIIEIDTDYEDEEDFFNRNPKNILGKAGWSHTLDSKERHKALDRAFEEEIEEHMNALIKEGWVLEKNREKHKNFAFGKARKSVKLALNSVKLSWKSRNPEIERICDEDKYWISLKDDNFFRKIYDSYLEVIDILAEDINNENIIDPKDLERKKVELCKIKKCPSPETKDILKKVIPEKLSKFQ